VALGGRFKVDEDLPAEVTALLLAAGHDARTVLEQTMVGWHDDRLWPAIVAEGRSLVTADVGFADARRLVNTQGVGIVLMRPGRESRKAYVELTQGLLVSFDVGRVAGCIVTVTPEAIRVHDTRK
jgi:hypothetical protein